MRSFLITLFGLMTVTVGFAQQAAYSTLECELASEKPGTIPGNLERLDLNGDPLACAIVRSPLDDLAFDGYIFKKDEIDKTENMDGWTYVVYLLNKAKNLTIRSKRYHEGVVTFTNPVKGGELWYIDVEGIDAPEVKVAEVEDVQNTFNVNIETEPFVNLYVDEELISPYSKADTSQFPYVYNLDLEEGKHYIASRYGDEEYPVKLNLKKNGQAVDARMGGTVIAKNAKDVYITPIDGPEAHYKPGGGSNTYMYDGMLGEYYIEGRPSAISVSKVKERFKVGQRSKTVFRIDEMVSYYFLMWHGSNLQPFGFTIGECKNFGWAFSFNTDVKHKINTPYGDSHFWEEDNSGGESKTIKWTAYTFATGPMIRLWHKWYLKLEGGAVRYLQTSEPHMLTADYQYKTGFAADAEFLWRIKALMIGAGYQRQFVKDAYNPNIGSQVSFSVGFAF